MQQSINRLYYLDWLRVLAMIGVFFFHNARFFDVWSDWHVKNASTSLGASVLIAFMVQWIMPLFFLIAGAGTYYALKSRKSGQYVKDRALRLFVPLVFGMLFIVVPQAYFEAVSHGFDLSGYNLFQVYVLYIQSLPELNWFHLWFIAYLFLFSILALPLFITLRDGAGILYRFGSKFTSLWLLLPVVVLAITAVNVFFYPDGFWGHRGSGGWNVVSNGLFFLFGYLIFANTRTMYSIKNLRWIFLGAAIVASACLFTFFVDQLADPINNIGTVKYVAAYLVQALNTWFWLFAIIGLASRYLSSRNKFVNYSNQAVLPFYVLHQTVIIVIGFYVVQWSAIIGLKYLIISLTSFIAIMTIYEIIVRRVNVFRFLFGMKATKAKNLQVSN